MHIWVHSEDNIPRLSDLLELCLVYQGVKILPKATLSTEPNESGTEKLEQKEVENHKDP